MTNPTAPTIAEWKDAGATSNAAVWDLAVRQMAYLESLPAQDSPRRELTDMLSGWTVIKGTGLSKDVPAGSLVLHREQWMPYSEALSLGVNTAGAFLLTPPPTAPPRRELTNEMVDMIRRIADRRRYWNMDEFKSVFASVLTPTPGEMKASKP